jgi:thiol-disulfide isomerase/thioredoxin
MWKLMLRAFLPLLLVLSALASQAPQVEIPLSLEPDSSNLGVNLDFAPAGPSRWQSIEPGGRRIVLEAAEGGGYWARLKDGDPYLLEEGREVFWNLPRPSILRYRRRANGGEDFLWSAAWRLTGKVPPCGAPVLLADTTANGIVDTSDAWLIDGQRVNTGKPFTVCGAEWIAEALTNDVLTLARLNLEIDLAHLPALRDAAGRVLAAQPGRARLIDFWASWCAPCLAALGPLKEFAAGHNLQWIAINVDDRDSLPNAEKLIAAGLLPPTVIARGLGEHDPLWRALATLGGRPLTLPSYVLTTADGRLQYAGPDLDELRRALNTPATHKP